MNKNQQAWASWQTGIGIICVLISVSDFYQRREFLLDGAVLIIGINAIIYGYLAKRNETIANRQILSVVVTALALVSLALIIFRLFIKQ